MLMAAGAGEDVGQWELSLVAGGNTKWCSHHGRQLVVSHKARIVLVYDPAIVLVFNQLS